jgi:hypothetical protein
LVKKEGWEAMAETGGGAGAVHGLVLPAAARTAASAAEARVAGCPICEHPWDDHDLARAEGCCLALREALRRAGQAFARAT